MALSRALAILLRTQPAEVPWRIVLRNTAAAILPLAAGVAGGHLAQGLGVAVGAISTMYSDLPGPYRQRLSRLLAVSLSGGMAAFTGLMLGPHPVGLLLATLAIGFAGGLLVVYGDATARVGMVGMILLVIAADLRASGAWDALESAGWIAAGGLLLTVFSIAAWPLQRYGPERQALAGVYRDLAALARRRIIDIGTEPGLSDSMVALQHTLLGAHRARGPVTDAFGVLLELAERIRLELTALAAEGTGDEAIGAIVREHCATVLEGLSRAIVAGAEADGSLARELASLESAERALVAADAPSRSAARRHLEALTGQLTAAARNVGRAAAAAGRRAAAQEPQLPRALRPESALATLTATLTPRSAAFRHALRTALTLALGVLLWRRFEIAHGYWIPMTVAIVLRADYGTTFSFGLLRVAGTVLGLLLTTALLHFLPADPWMWIAVMAVLCAGFRYFGPVHYGVAVACLTGMVVLLLGLAGEAPEPTMLSRLIATVIGSAMALLAFGLWPTRERTRIRRAFAQLLEAYAGYILAFRLSGPSHDRREARQAVRVARANATAALGRLRAEPATPRALAELSQSLLTNSNRLAHTAMTLDAALGEAPAIPAQASFGALIERAAGALRQQADSLRGSVPAPPSAQLRGAQRELALLLGRESSGGIATELAELTDRLVDNVNTLAHVLARAGREPGAGASR